MAENMQTQKDIPTMANKIHGANGEMEGTIHGGNESTDVSSNSRGVQAITIGKLRASHNAKNLGGQGYDCNVHRIHFSGDYCDHRSTRRACGHNLFTPRVHGVLYPVYHCHSATWSHVSARGITL